MADPLVSVVVPTVGRTEALRRAVRSALAQSVGDLEVIVVDDGSPSPVQVDHHDGRVRVERHDRNRGLAAALNTGVRAARGRWIAQLDDDDEMYEHLVGTSLAAIEACKLPPPVMAVSGIEEVAEDGTVTNRAMPPTRRRGQHWSLEPADRDTAYEVRNTMVAERNLLLDHPFDEKLRSSVRNDLFLRLNPVCSIVGVPVVTYRRWHHAGGDRVSTSHALKHQSFVYMVDKHRSLYEQHPTRFAHYLRRDAQRLRQLHRRREALRRYGEAARYDPVGTAKVVAHDAVLILRRRLRSSTTREGS